ncbi:MAG: hypothetical protein HEQ22_13070 [Sphingopyxis sp.]|uniref:hypothetical protein n=1 Tax=Sphingopyxis sp. TaxID=1908224 RepID=UPI003D80EBB9
MTAGLIAIGLFSTATTAHAIDINSAASIGANSSAEQARAFPAGRDNSPKAVLARLDRLCASKRSADQRRCEKAWRVINQAHADLQARRAATTD